MNIRYKYLFIFSLFFLGELAAGTIGDGKESGAQIGEVFRGEVLKYEIGFWFLFPVAQGIASFQEAGLGKYKVWHEGRTFGFVGWLTGHRQEIYKSFMTTTNEGRRLIPLRFEEEIISWGRVRTKKTIYDYNQRKITIFRETLENKSVQEKEIPAGFLYDDPVTAFYNFRHGVYGRVEQGKEFILRTIPEKGEEVILIRVATAEETEARRAEEKSKEKKDFLVHIILNREMWGKKKVEIEIWFDKRLTPISGMVKDLPFLGNIYGKCTYRGFSP
ncbi:MAG: DUF3108 domain-containing protein [Thermodesulfobacteriota bacterium]